MRASGDVQPEKRPETNAAYYANPIEKPGYPFQGGRRWSKELIHRRKNVPSGSASKFGYQFMRWSVHGFVRNWA
jgi:hypothetical protein